MKLKSLLELIGIRGKPKHYHYEPCDFDLGSGCVVHYAQWLHPAETKKSITPEQVAAYSKYVGEGDFCIDIGAHTGDSTLPMAVAAGKTGMVLALEPNSFLYHVLEKNARSNTHVANIRTMMAAAVSDEGFSEFEYSDSGFCNGGRHEGISSLQHGHAFKLNVWGVNLSQELKSDFGDFLPKLKFIKVDAEGYDLYILRFIADIITTYRPTIKAEIFKFTSPEYRREMLAFFQERNYSVFRIAQEPIGIGPPLTNETLDEIKQYDILCVPDSAKTDSHS
ncbi:MAG: FkbM family methyltransferase [Pirellulaceae bacterium]